MAFRGSSASTAPVFITFWPSTAVSTSSPFRIFRKTCRCELFPVFVSRWVSFTSAANCGTTDSTKSLVTPAWDSPPRSRRRRASPRTNQTSNDSWSSWELESTTTTTRGTATADATSIGTGYRVRVVFTWPRPSGHSTDVWTTVSSGFSVLGFRWLVRVRASGLRDATG